MTWLQSMNIGPYIPSRSAESDQSSEGTRDIAGT